MGEVLAQKPKLAIVVGHTQKAPGAVAVPPLSLTEYEYNTSLAEFIQGLCLGRGVDCRIFFRDGIGLTRCYRKVEDWEADAVVELHFNSFSDPKARGTVTLCGLDKESQALATQVHAQIVAVLERRGKDDRGLKPLKESDRGGVNVNLAEGIPNVLIEPFFGSNPEDAALGKAKKRELASSVVLGFSVWLKQKRDKQNDPA